jgi:PKD repeat protein
MKNRLIPALACWVALTGCTALTAQNNTVTIVGPSLVCVGSCNTYTFTTSNPTMPPIGSVGSNWTLSGPNGLSVSQDQIIFYHCFSIPGAYSLQVQAFLNNGNISWDTLTIFATQYFPVEIISDNPATCNPDSSGADPNDQYCEKVCPYSTVTYSLLNDPILSGGINNASISWNVAGAQSYTIDPLFKSSVTVTWGPSGAGSVSVVFSTSSQGGTANNCVGEDALCVTIVEEPRAQFDSDPAPPPSDTLEICKGQTVWFNNLSQHADTYEWYFGDDYSNTDAVHPQHTFNTPGLFTVHLIARSACLCSDTTARVVRVLDADAPLLDCVGDVCAGATVTYTASANCSDISWSVSPNGAVLAGGAPGADSITIQWGAGPAGTITLGNYTCSGVSCPYPTQVQVPIIDDYAEIRGAERVCPDAEEVYTIDPYGGTGFVWTLSGGGTILDGQGANSVSVRWAGFPNPNTTYWLIVRYDNCYLGCGGVDSIPVRIVSSFYVEGPVEACQNSGANFVSRLRFNNANLACNWTLLAHDGTVAWVSATPGAAVTAPFANGPGIYRLFAEPANPLLSCTDQAEWTIRVPDLPAAPSGIAGATLICPGNTFTYEATGVTPGASIHWQIQNGPAAPVTATGNPLNVTWNATGPYQLTAVQRSTDGLECPSAPVQLNLQVLNTLLVNGPAARCADSKATYTTALIPGLNYQWSLVPATAGTIAQGQGTNQVQVFWQTPGNHQVQVQVCSQTAARAVTVNGLPAPAVNAPAGLCPGATATVQTASPYAAYTWANAGGGTISSATAVDIGPGDYVLSVTDTNGCTGNENFSIATLPQPVLTVSTADPTAFCANAFLVSMRALVSAGSALTYEWIKDGAPLGINAAVYTTNQYGLYTVLATNAEGCTATAGPVAIVEDCTGGSGGGFPCTPRPPCPPGSVTLTIDPSARCDSMHFSLSGPDYLSGSGSWAFVQSGGSAFGTFTGDQVGFNFPEPGYFIVAAYAELTNGQLCRIIDSVIVEAVAQFNILPECAGLATGFDENSAFMPASSITAWIWDFGDPGSGANNTASIQTPAHPYAASGSYPVSLTITANSGCTAVATQTALIPQAAPPLLAAPAGACANNALEFSATGASLNWDFGDPGAGALNSASGQPVYHLFSAGNYTVTATAEDRYGCMAAASLLVSIAPNALNGQITPNTPAPICEGNTLVLTAPSGGQSYLWSDNSSGNTLTVGKEGVYSVTLTDANGCTYTPPPVSVNVIPAPDALIKALLTNSLGQIIGTSYPTLSVCQGEDVFLIAAGQPGNTYTWSTTTTGPSLEFSEYRGNLLTVGPHVFTVTVTEATNGCTAVTDPFLVTVNPVPSGFSIANSVFPACAGSTNTLSYSGPNPGNWQFFWNTGQTDLPLVTENPGIYALRVVNEFGCEARSNPLTILPGPNVGAIPAGCHSRCKPDTLCLPALPNIVSWQWYFNGSPLPGATGPAFVAQQSGTYYAELRDIFGCSSQSEPLSLNLFDGYGNILGQVWADVNGNGFIDGPDTLVSGIPVTLTQNNTAVSAAQSNVSGGFAFTNILSNNYTVEINAAGLPAGWQIVIGQNPATLTGCGGESQVGLLLKAACTNAVTSNVQLSACPNETVLYNGTPVAAGSSQTFLLTTAEGCDSLVTVNVAVLPPSSAALQASACAGSSFDYNGTPVAAGTSQQFLLQNYLGCDSLLTVNVSALPPSSAALQASACAGESFDYNGTPVAAGTSQQFLLQNYLGCDSLLTVNVSALPPSLATLQASACAGESFDYNGTPVAAGTSQQFLLQNYLGCDSLLTVNVSALPPSLATLQASACAGESFDYNGTPVAAGTSQQFLLQNYLGCDSLLTVNVSALPPSLATLQASACAGESFDYNGTPVAAGTSQQFLLQNYLGCDSLLTVNVAISPTSTSTLQARLCPGGTFIYEGIPLQIGAIQAFTLQNAAGCDSIVTVSVSALSTSSETRQVTICPNETYTFNGVELQPGDTQVFQFTNSEGCDSIIIVVVSAFPAATFDLTPAVSCLQTGTGSIAVVNTAGGLPPHRFSLDGVAFQDPPLFEGLLPGAYTVWLEDSNGCLFQEMVAVPALAALAVELTAGRLPCDGGGVRLEPVVGGDLGGLEYVWSTGERTPSIDVFDPGVLWVEVRNNCETLRREVAVSWADVGADHSFVYLPNVFAPLSFDPDNSRFKPYFAPGLRLLDYELAVFDRWGNLMFRTHDTEDGWAGPFRDEDMQPGVYVWYMRADIDYCGRIRRLIRQGDVTIVR